MSRGAGVKAIAVIAPAGLGTVEGNSQSSLPFSDIVDFGAYVGPIRYQQVYNSSDFSQLPDGGAYLTGIFFRGDCLSREGVEVTNLQVNLSTTSAKADTLSATFADNIGTDDMQVAALARAAFPNLGNHCPAVWDSDAIVLDVPFFYDPAKGNLLMDLRTSGASPPPRTLSIFDTQSGVDSVSRVVAYSLSATTAQVMDSEGLVTLFGFYERPRLIVTLETNTVVIKWPYQPDPFKLQWRDSLTAAPTWQDFTGNVALVFGGYKVATIPLKGSKSKRFYRLFWNSPQPLLSGPSGAAAGTGAAPATP